MKRTDYVLLFIILMIMAVFALGSYPNLPFAQNAHPAQAASKHDDTTIIGEPTISLVFINQVLCEFASPACGTGEALYRYGVEAKIDPVFALAFFYHESNFGKAGEAQKTKSLGNLRCISTTACIDQSLGGYASFASWEEGYHAWYTLLAGELYVGDGRTTLETIIPRYAPAGDGGNDESRYIAIVKQAVQLWREGKVEIP